MTVGLPSQGQTLADSGLHGCLVDSSRQCDVLQRNAD